MINSCIKQKNVNMVNKAQVMWNTPAPKKMDQEKVPARMKEAKRMSSILIKVGEGRAYASVLRKLRIEVKLDTSESTVVCTRTTLILLD